jgi:mono/diheme cytochrome c family protein
MRHAVVALILALPAAAQLPPPPQSLVPDAVASAVGQIIYQRYCGSCHGAVGKGDGALVKDLAVAPTDLTQLAKANGGKFPFDHVVQVIDGRHAARGHGTPEMPVWGEIFPKTKGTESPSVENAVARITHYIWSIQSPPAPAGAWTPPRR